MNNVKLRGLLTNIRPSHTINDVAYDQADLVIPRSNGKEDTITLKFKRFCNKYEEDQIISLQGNVRSYSEKLPDGRNKVELYVFTYFDVPDLTENDEEAINEVEIDGRICKIEPIRQTRDNKQNIHFILANNLIIEETNQKLNSYPPCIAWGRLARQVEKLSVNTKVKIKGQLHSREYKKMIDDENFEYRLARELVVDEIEVID